MDFSARANGELNRGNQTASNSCHVTNSYRAHLHQGSWPCHEKKNEKIVFFFLFVTAFENTITL